jgi:hypothetical protein
VKRLALIVGMVVCLSSHSPLEARESKETKAKLSAAKSIFLGWVDLPADGWGLWGYPNQEAWMDAIKTLNLNFQSNCRSNYLPGRLVTAAKDRNDENAAGSDLYIKFSDVHIDPETYGVSLSIHFIDPKTSTEIASVPSQLYYERRLFQFASYVSAALDDVGLEVQSFVGARRRK